MTALDRISSAARAVLEEAGIATEAVAEDLLAGRGDWPSLTADQADLLRRTGCPLPAAPAQEQAS